VEGTLAFQMRRAVAARNNESGLQILNLPQLAARLAGGFTGPTTAEFLDPAIQRALDQGGFAELERVRHLPGMARAVARTFRKAWDADVDLRALGDAKGGRIRELAIIDERMRAHLPRAMLTPRDLRNAALERIDYAPRLIGPLSIEGLSYMPPVWRPLITALSKVVAVEWRAPRQADAEWFSGALTTAPPVPAIAPAVVACADPHHEVVESLRWARNLIASGKAKPHQIAIASASSFAWDDHFLALGADTGLRLHFAHGIPALSTRDGQRCAALADVLLHGLSQQRVRRLFILSQGQGLALDRLPERWLSALPRGAPLPNLEDWQRAITAAKTRDVALASIEAVPPMLTVLVKGPVASNEAAGVFLRGRSLQIWEAATRSAPADAIELSLQHARLAPETDAADSIVWCSARDLAASPRPHVRLLGLTNRSWPRRVGDDPILPNHVLPEHAFDIDPVSRADRRHFEVILEAASGGVVLSRSRRGGQGSRVGCSPLLQDRAEITLSRARIPEHAFSEADRLMARPKDAAGLKRIKSAALCWQHWHVEPLTAHDGQFSGDHPVITRAIERVQSATSLQRLLRDPLGFVWRYALGWTVPQEREQPLSIAPDEFGKLVHELLRRAVTSLEPDPGYAKASDGQIEEALRTAATHVRDTWPLERPVPPKLLWSNTVDYAADMALVGLLRKDINDEGTRSWTEVPFGQPKEFVAGRELPWDATMRVAVPNTPIFLRGTIDRLDLRRDPFAVRVTDYKTGRQPQNAASMIIAGGNELQRALYGLASRQLLEGEPKVVARLLYLSGAPEFFKLGNLDAAIEQISAFVTEAVGMLQRGTAVPGRLAYDRSNDLRLALPASPSYERRKSIAFGKAADSLRRFWSAR
jgi:PD-(D/E)XK nuclease superfamily